MRKWNAPVFKGKPRRGRAGRPRSGAQNAGVPFATRFALDRLRSVKLGGLESLPMSIRYGSEAILRAHFPKLTASGYSLDKSFLLHYTCMITISYFVKTNEDNSETKWWQEGDNL